MSEGKTINEAFTKMVLKSAERLMYAAEVRVAVMGHTIDVYATWIFVRMETVWVEVAVLGTLTIISMSGAWVVSKTAVEHVS